VARDDSSSRSGARRPPGRGSRTEAERVRVVVYLPGSRRREPLAHGRPRSGRPGARLLPRAVRDGGRARGDRPRPPRPLRRRPAATWPRLPAAAARGDPAGGKDARQGGPDLRHGGGGGGRPGTLWRASRASLGDVDVSTRRRHPLRARPPLGSLGRREGRSAGRPSGGAVAGWSDAGASAALRAAPASSRPSPGRSWSCVKGEKAADAARLCGLLATTSAGGSQRPRRKSDWSPLGDREVWVLPDHDEPRRGLRGRSRLAGDAGGCPVRPRGAARGAMEGTRRRRGLRRRARNRGG